MIRVGLDIETAPVEEGKALMPYHRDFYVQMVGIVISKNDKLLFHNPYEAAVFMAGKSSFAPVAWNAKFDCAGLLRYQGIWERLHWYDGYLAWCWAFPDWHEPGGKSLVEAAEQIKLPWAEKLREMKEREKREGFQTDQTGEYCLLDAQTALVLEQIARAHMDSRRLKGYEIECRCIVPVARSWKDGLRLDIEYIHELQEELHCKIDEILKTGKLPPKEVLNSPQQLAQWLYHDLGLPVQFWTEKGNPSTDKAALAFAALQDERAKLVHEYRDQNTRLSKFVESPLTALEFNGYEYSFGDGYVYPEPRLFGTYTGRMTYSSKVLKKYPTGIALHQWPRDKRFRKMIIPPPGYMLAEYDFSGQEMRLMGEFSKDARMIELFRPGGLGDAHSLTGASIAGIEFEEFLRRKKTEDPEIVGPRGFRYQGKFVNLSLQYRTSWKKLRIRALTDYDYYATEAEAKHWHSTYHKLYPGVRRYWDAAIARAAYRGYAETLGGRRTLTPQEYFSNPKMQWPVESTAINHPIQGSGADQKEYALALATRKFPEAIFAFDLHDGLFFYLPEDRAEELAREMLREFNSIDWSVVWDRELDCVYPVECALGDTWGTMREIK